MSLKSKLKKFLRELDHMTGGFVSNTISRGDFEMGLKKFFTYKSTERIDELVTVLASMVGNVDQIRYREVIDNPDKEDGHTLFTQMMVQQYLDEQVEYGAAVEERLHQLDQRKINKLTGKDYVRCFAEIDPGKQPAEIHLLLVKGYDVDEVPEDGIIDIPSFMKRIRAGVLRRSRAGDSKVAAAIVKKPEELSKYRRRAAAEETLSLFKPQSGEQQQEVKKSMAAMPHVKSKISTLFKATAASIMKDTAIASKAAVGPDGVKRTMSEWIQFYWTQHRSKSPTGENKRNSVYLLSQTLAKTKDK